MESVDVTLKVGLPIELRREAAQLYLDAFDRKLGPVLGRGQRAVGYLAQTLQLSKSIVALGPEGQLLGLAGFHDDRGGFVGGGFGDLRQHYGLIGAAWRGVLLSLFERAPPTDQLLMDGVVVTEQSRGLGIGTELLNGVGEVAKARELPAIRLDVVDTNPRARALYERHGFTAEVEQSVWPLHRLFGFRKSTTMVKMLEQGGDERPRETFSEDAPKDEAIGSQSGCQP